MIPCTKNVFSVVSRGLATGSMDLEKGFQSSLQAALVHFQNKKDILLKSKETKGMFDNINV